MQTEPEQWAEALWDHLLNKTFSRRQAIEAIQRAFEEREWKLREENARLRKMQVPEWFYADGYSSEDCQDSPDEVLENIDLKPGKHVVSVDCAGPMPKIWCAVHVLTDEEMDALKTDDRVSFTEHDSEQAAHQALEADHGA